MSEESKNTNRLVSHDTETHLAPGNDSNWWGGKKLQASRRSFLQASACGAAGMAIPQFISSTALAAPGRPGANDRIGMGFIGCGRQTIQKNIPLLMRTPGVQAVALCEVDAWRMQKAVEKVKSEYDRGKVPGSFKGIDTYVDYEDLLARDDIDAVCIGTPDHWHFRMAIDAMKAGKDVALEKPIARSIGDSRRYLQAVKQYQRVFRVDSEFRSGTGPHRATWLVRNGYLGQPRQVVVTVPQIDQFCPPQAEMPVPPELDYQRWLGDAPQVPYTEKRVHPHKSFNRPGWFSMLDYADGVVTNWGAHVNNGAMWATNKERTGPVEISGTGSYLPPESFYDVLYKFDIQYRFADGLEWRYQTGKGANFRIVGEEGWVQAGFGKEFEASSEALKTMEPKASDQTFPLISEKQDFINCVRSREETLEPAEVGHCVNTLGKLGQISIHLGKSLQWDPQQEQFSNEPEAMALIDKHIVNRPPPSA